MAIRLPDGTVLRNLQEQVLKNKQDIEKHYDIDRVLSDYGIKVIGEATAENLLPDPLTYTGAYGDAYAVGVIPPFSFYIFTRPFEGETEPHWFNLGKLAISGPAGINGKSAYDLAKDAGFEGTEAEWLASLKGETGEQGERGSRIYVVSAPINNTVGYITGDVYIILNEENELNGTVATFNGTSWVVSGNITGPVGERGRPGENGTPGDAVRIVGIITSANQLPDPSTVARDTAYVAQIEGEGQFLYFITGTDNVIWSRVPFENGTTVTVGGLPVEVFNADTKVDMPPNKVGHDRLIGTMASGVIWYPKVSPTDTAQYSIPMRGSDGSFVVGTPTASNKAVPKSYVDTAVNQKIPMPTNPTTYDKVPAIKMVDGVPTTRLLFIDNVVAKETINGNQSGSVLATYRNQTATTNMAGYNKVLISGEPVGPSHVATKNYVDTNTGWIHITFVDEGDTYTLEDGVPFELMTEGPLAININFDDASVVSANTVKFFGANPTTTTYAGQYTTIRSNTLTNFVKKPVSLQSTQAESGVYLRYIRPGQEISAS